MPGPLKNPKHEAFARGIIEGKTQRESYLSAGYACTPEAADVGGVRLMSNKLISERVEELKAKVTERSIEKAAITKTYLEEKVHNLAAKAEDKDQLGVARLCYEMLGRDRGAFQERKTITVRSLGHLTEDEILDELARLDAGDQGEAEGGLEGGTGKARSRKAGTRGTGKLLN